MEVAQRAGAVVRREPHQGKGHVVRRMFTDVEADIYVLVDGDATYDAPSARPMIARLLEQRLDMVVAARVDQEKAAYRPGHRAGNWLLTHFVTVVFGRAFSDLLSGYRVFSRRVAGSASKLNTWRDGFRILWTIVKLYRSERPLQFFSAIGVVLATIAIVLAIPVVATFLREGVVPRLPTAILSTGLMLAALLSFMSGLVLDTVTRGRRELKLLAYLAHRAPGEDRRQA
jgi:hypothetical protein